MDIKREDFPLYALLEALNNPEFLQLQADMHAAEAGRDESANSLALGLYGVVTIPNLGSKLPGFTEDIKRATLQKCKEIWTELAQRNHPVAPMMLRLMQNPSGPAAPAP